MPFEVDNQRNRAAQNDGRRKYVSDGWNTEEKDQHAADRENCPAMPPPTGIFARLICGFGAYCCTMHLLPTTILLQLLTATSYCNFLLQLLTANHDVTDAGVLVASLPCGHGSVTSVAHIRRTHS
jgi:hypothetical protein